MAENPKLTVLYEKLRGKTFKLDKDVMSVGRKEGVDIRLADPSLSGHHADIIRSEQDGRVFYTLRDNESTNGTRVNNVPITEQVLKNSDLILFGVVEVLFDGAPDIGEDDATGTFSQQTHTIDISGLDGNTATTASLTNFNPLAEQEERKHALIQKGLIALLVLLALLVILVLVYVVLQLPIFKGGTAS